MRLKCRQYEINKAASEEKELRTFSAVLALAAHGALAFVASLWKHVARSRRVARVRLTRVVRIGASWTCREKSIKENDRERGREKKKKDGYFLIYPCAPDKILLLAFWSRDEDLHCNRGHFLIGFRNITIPD